MRFTKLLLWYWWNDYVIVSVQNGNTKHEQIRELNFNTTIEVIVNI
mgnify:CR=1 FL=1